MGASNRLRELLQRTGLGYRLALMLKYGARRPKQRPHAPWCNTVLKQQKEVRECLDQIHRLRLPPAGDVPKNWDSLVALDLILSETDPNARIFDAGGELYSMILPWLFLYGYRNLVAGNLVFTRPRKVGPIRYVYCDITATAFPDAYFDAVTCLSVIEHGVDLPAYFKEMSRILKPHGLLFTSTDYFETPIDTKGQIAYGTPIHIFNRQEVEDAIGIARRYGLESPSPIDLKSEDAMVHWSQYDLHYTFLNFYLRKVGGLMRASQPQSSTRGRTLV